MPEEKVEEKTEEKIDESQEEKTEESELEQSEEEESSTSKEEKTPEEEIAELQEKLDKSESKNQKTLDSMQKRIDQLTAKSHQAEELAAKGKERTWEDMTSAEIEPYIDHYEEEGNKKMVRHLIKIQAKKETLEEVSKDSSTKEKAQQKVYWRDKTVKDYPDMLKEDSDLAIAANDIYSADKDLQAGGAKGAYMAVVAANEQILRTKLKGADKKVKAANANVNKTNVKTSLESGNMKSGDVDTLTKAHKAAVDSGDPMSKEWRTYLSLREKHGLDGKNKF